MRPQCGPLVVFFCLTAILDAMRVEDNNAVSISIPKSPPSEPRNTNQKASEPNSGSPNPSDMNGPPIHLRDLILELDPDIVKPLAGPVLEKIAEDPLFAINVEENKAEEVKSILATVAEEYGEEYDYDYLYDVDYEEGAQPAVTVTNILEGLDPKVLAKIPPDWLVSYFESLTIEKIKSILGDSSILLSIPPKNVVELLRKLPEESVTTIVNSEAVHDLYSSVQGNLDDEEFERAREWRSDVVSELILKVEAEKLIALPDFLIFSQLEDVTAVRALLGQPEKLALLVTEKTNLVDKLSVATIVEALNCTLVYKLAKSQFFHVLTASIPSVLDEVFSSNKSLVDCIPNSTILKLAEAADLAMLSDSILSSVVTKQPKIISQIPAETIAVIIKSRSTMISNLPEEALSLIIVERQDVLPLLSDEDFISLLDQKPSILTLIVEHLPTSQLISFLSSRPRLLPSLPISMDPIILNLLEEKRFETKLVKVIVAMPAQTLATLASTRPWLISYVPDAALELLVSERDDLLPLLSDDNLLNLLSFRPTLLSAFAQLPAERLSPILRDRPALTERLPPSAEPILSSLLLRKSFLSKLSMSLMASLATSPGILKLITKYSLIQVLTVHPTLPAHLDTSSLPPLFHFVEDPWFRARLPCATVTSLIKMPGISATLPVSVLENVLTSRRLLACLPASFLEQVLASKDSGLENMSMSALFTGAVLVPKEKLTMKMLADLLMKQVPEIARELIRRRISMK